MRCTRVIIGRLVVGVGLLLAARGAWAAPGDVLASFDSPCAYPAGIAFGTEHLYVVDWRGARIHQLNPDDGSVVRSFDAPTLRPHGIAWADGRLLISDSHSGAIHIVDAQTGNVLRAFQAPGSKTVGLAYHDGVIYLLEQRSRQIYKVMPEDGTILGYFDAPARNAACLAHDGRYLWVSDRIKDEFYCVDPARELVVAIVAAPGPYPVGVAHRDGALWNVDFQTRRVYRLALHDEQPYRLSEPRVARVEYVWGLYNYGPGDVTDLAVRFGVPMKLPNQELLSACTYSVEPTRRVTDRWGQKCVVFELGTVPGGTRQLISYHVDAKVHAIRYLIDPARTGTLADIPADIRAAYTVNGSRYRIDSEYIQDTVRDVVGDEKTCYWIARKIYNHVIKHLEYQMIGGWDVPEVVLERGSGSCSEYTFAFIALCRAAGLPARYQGSIVVRGDDASIDEAFHRWAQVYLPNYGWVPVDANRGDADSPADQARGFGELSNRFLITTQGGGDSEYLRWGYNSHATRGATGYAHIQEENFGFWEPLEQPEDQEPMTKQTPLRSKRPGQCRP